MNRRGFLKSLSALGAAAWLAPYLPAFPPAPTGIQAVILDAPMTGTIGAINRATFAFWRNQQVGESSQPITLAQMQQLSTAFDQCEL